jgi:hypothetical protein
LRRPSRFVFHRSSAFAVLATLVVGGCASGPKPDPSSDAELAVADSPSIEPAPATIPTESDFKLVASIFGPDGVAQADADSEEPSVDEGDALRTWCDVVAGEETGENGIAVDLMAPGAPPPSLAELAAFLERLAAVADDPVPYQMAAAILPLVAADASLGEGLTTFQPAAEQLSTEEVAMCEALATFASAVRGRLDAGDLPREALLFELSELVGRLRQEPELRIGGAEICSAIRGFGDFEPMPHQLKARTDQDVLVYVPLEGLDWIRNAATARHGWRIRHRIELHQLSDGLVVDPGSWTDLAHDLPQPTRDTYFWVRYTIPGSDLAAGRFALKVRVEEPATGREVERTIELELLPERLLARE